jgi:hypothetical protein
MKQKNMSFSLKKVFILIVLIVCSKSAFGQGNLQYVDDKPIHFGFSLGTNLMDFGVTPSDSARVSTLKPGFSVGIITDLRLSRYFNLRFTPTLHFGERQLNFRFKNGPDSTSITSIPICLPIYLKYSAERKDNYRPYLIAGGGAYINLSRDESKAIVLNPFDYYAEFGIGCDIYFSFFKLAPELKYSIGLNNMLTPLSQRGNPTNQSDLKFTNALSRLTSRMITLTFNFE